MRLPLTYLIFILPVIFAGSIYLLGVFFTTDFDINNWSRDARLVIALFMGIAMLVGVFLGYSIDERARIDKRINKL